MAALLLAAAVAAGGGGGVFDVTKFGATGSGTTYDTQAVRKAAAALDYHGMTVSPGLGRIVASHY